MLHKDNCKHMLTRRQQMVLKAAIPEKPEQALDRKKYKTWTARKQGGTTEKLCLRAKWRGVCVGTRERQKEEGECERGRQSVIVKQHWLKYTCEFAVPH